MEINFIIFIIINTSRAFFLIPRVRKFKKRFFSRSCFLCEAVERINHGKKKRNIYFFHTSKYFFLKIKKKEARISLLRKKNFKRFFEENFSFFGFCEIDQF